MLETSTMEMYIILKMILIEVMKIRKVGQSFE